MTDFHALDLSGDRAALHRWDGRGWVSVATTALHDTDDTVGRVLADLLRPVAGLPVGAALPVDRITVTDFPADATPDVPHGGRIDWIALPSGGWRRMVLPDAALAEVETFLTALGVRPSGCMAAAGDDLPPAWFGTSRSPVIDGRAADRPRCLGPAGSAPHGRIAAARLRARAVAARDPAHLIPLPDDAAPADPAARAGRFTGLRRALSTGRGQALAVGLLLMAGLGFGLVGWTMGPDRDPTHHMPDVDLLAMAPAPAATPATPGQDMTGDAPRRAATPRLDAVSDTAQTENAPQPARQPSLSAMDAPPGMNADATFYSPPHLLSAVAATGADPLLTIPGLDPVFRTDALALQDARPPDAVPAARQTLNPPGPPEQTLVVDERGLIRPSPEGRVSPDGFTVVAGLPPAAVRPRPERLAEDVVVLMRRADLPEDDPLRRLLPQLRPEGLAERRERDQLGGRTAGELAVFVPRQRPASPQEQAGPSVVMAPTIALGPRPAPRDMDMLARARTTAQRQSAPSAPSAQSAESAPAGPAIAAADVARVSAPTSGTVAERATTRVSINLSEINLLGTFGAGNSRRALVRLPSGKVVNLSVGDRVDGGRVQSIGDGQLGYVKSGRTVMLVMPRG